MWVQSLGWEDLLEKEMETHSGILSWRIPWTDEPPRSHRRVKTWLIATEQPTTHWRTLASSLFLISCQPFHILPRGLISNTRMILMGGLEREGTRAATPGEVINWKDSVTRQLFTKPLVCAKAETKSLKLVKQTRYSILRSVHKNRAL